MLLLLLDIKHMFIRKAPACLYVFLPNGTPFRRVAPHWRPRCDSKRLVEFNEIGQWTVNAKRTGRVRIGDKALKGSLRTNNVSPDLV